jgi:hypothetical protein
VNETPVVVDQEPIDVETGMAREREHPDCEGWISDAEDSGADISPMPEEQEPKLFVADERQAVSSCW